MENVSGFAKTKRDLAIILGGLIPTATKRSFREIVPIQWDLSLDSIVEHCRRSPSRSLRP